MALGNFVFYSQEIKRQVHVNYLIPDHIIWQEEGKGIPTLYLLHGHGNCCEEWISNSNIQEYAMKQGLAVMMPEGENSFYLNQKGAHRNYENYVGRELVEFTRKLFPLSKRREDTFVGGISMGGFGAIHTGLAFPETFGKVMALSSALIIHQVAGKQEGYEDPAGDYEYYRSIFGDLAQLLTSHANPEQLILDLQAEGKRIPELYMACGTEDFLLEHNREFKRFLDAHQVPVEYQESPGDHNFTFWNPYLESGLAWMLANRTEV